MKRLSACIAAAFWIALAGAAHADKPVIVVELFTSQGCSSCPPADAFLHKLAKREDVIALSLHVDYWDYIGWKDVFGDPRNTARQKGYAKAGHRRSVYTPQMVIQGREHVVGNHPLDVAELINAHQEQPLAVALVASQTGGEVTIKANAGAPSGGVMVVQLVRFERSATVDIKRGENAGQEITYVNVVRDWQVVGEWDGSKPLLLKTAAKGDLPAVVIVQGKGYGRIMAAARVN